MQESLDELTNRLGAVTATDHDQLVALLVDVLGVEPRIAMAGLNPHCEPIFGDEETVTGFLLAGVGHRTVDGTNYLIVKPDTKVPAVEEAFRRFTTRRDVSIILINQHVANDIRHLTSAYTQTIPTILEIPSKDHPYDPKQDYIMARVNQMLGAGV